MRTLFEAMPRAKFIYAARSEADFALKDELVRIGEVSFTTERLSPEYIKNTVARGVPILIMRSDIFLTTSSKLLAAIGFCMITDSTANAFCPIKVAYERARDIIFRMDLV